MGPQIDIQYDLSAVSHPVCPLQPSFSYYFLSSNHYLCTNMLLSPIRKWSLMGWTPLPGSWSQIQFLSRDRQKKKRLCHQILYGQICVTNVFRRVFEPCTSSFLIDLHHTHGTKPLSPWWHLGSRWLVDCVFRNDDREHDKVDLGFVWRLSITTSQDKDNFENGPEHPKLWENRVEI